MRIALLAWLATGVVLLVGAASSPALPPPVHTSGIYVVRPDPRLCPSPLCGGYWVALANHARTRCHDGLLRPRCYVAVAVSTLTREPLTTALQAGSLVRAAIGTWTFDGIGELGAVLVADAWTPDGPRSAVGSLLPVAGLGNPLHQGALLLARRNPSQLGFANDRLGSRPHGDRRDSK